MAIWDDFWILNLEDIDNYQINAGENFKQFKFIKYFSHRRVGYVMKVQVSMCFNTALETWCLRTPVLTCTYPRNLVWRKRHLSTWHVWIPTEVQVFNTQSKTQSSRTPCPGGVWKVLLSNDVLRKRLLSKHTKYGCST